MDNQTLHCLEKAKEYIDGITVNSPVNIPERVLEEEGFFTWDNEKREISTQPYLFQWSYYNGVVFEGLYDVYQAEKDEKYLSYVRSYFEGLTDSNGLIFRRAGYVDYHGADCYKTAALLCRFAAEDERYFKVLESLYSALTDENYVNEDGHVICKDFVEEGLGGNFWHSWRRGNPPRRYKLWLDGIYMLQPFIARFSVLKGDKPQAEKVARRLQWVAENMQAENGLYYHASNGGGDNCPFFWTRSFGWYAMALVDVAEAYCGGNDNVVGVCAAALERFIKGALPYRTKNNMWLNLADMPETETNRRETSGTSMMVYAMLKGARLGLLDKSYTEPALQSFRAICDSKLSEKGLCDIYFKASANGTDNYQNIEDYLTDEGKGLGPFIMAYSEVLRLK